MTANADQIEYWNEVAGAKWVGNQTKLDRLMAPLSEVLIDAAAARRGEYAIDIGCGCGDLALRLTTPLGPSGRILAVDVSRPMLAHAEDRARAAAPGAPIEWLLTDAMVHDFPSTADLMVSRFGVMFFDDRPRAFANLQRALKPGGRFAFLAWRRRARCEWMQWPLDQVASAIPIPEDVPEEIGPFALADHIATRALLERAGFHDVRIEPVDRPVIIGTSVEEALALLLDAGPAARLLREAEPEPKARAVERLRDALAERETSDGIVLGAACWLYAGRV